MTVFKHYFKIMKSHRSTIIGFTAILIGITILSAGSDVSEKSFSIVKPNMAIVNEDTDSIFLNSFNSYLEETANIKEVATDEATLRDALFVREVDYVLVIPKGFTEDFMNSKNPKINSMTIPDSYGAIYTEMLLDRFLNIAKVYVDSGMDQQQIVDNMKTDFSKMANVEFMNASNNAEQGSLNFYYNFANYTILMICVYVIAMIMSSFNNIKIKRRNLISKTNYKKINAQLFAGNFCLVLLIWALYAVIALVIYPNSMLTGQGLLMAINSLVFCISALSIGFLIGSLIKSKEATIGISNILALGSSFICGAFVPQEILSSFLLKVGKFLPSYWYIKANDDIALLSNYNFNALQPIFINMLIVLGFAILIYVITNITTKLKLKTA